MTDVLSETELDLTNLRVLDLGAGNGMVGDELKPYNAEYIAGVDIIAEAKVATERDRDGVYDDYFVLDMTDISDRDLLRFESLGLNCLTCVAALGFGDIPPAAFANAYNLIAQGGWIAFNIKSDFLESEDPCGFASLIQRMIDDGVMSVRTGQQYEHRQATNGEPLLYTAFVGAKNRDVPAGWEL
jgi:predicted TPR repeat methyltransferase